MTMPRYVPTRLLEAGDREAKACFAQASLAVESLYRQQDGSWRILAYPLMPNEVAAPWQINIVNVPQQFEMGTSGVSDNLHQLEFAFHFPINILQFPVGTSANTYLDHIYAFKAWLARGGTWGERIAADLHGAIEDPDNDNSALVTVQRIEWDQPRPAPGNSAIVVPVIVTFQSREDSQGVVK